jgi:8-oxo-dGTP pyrophosphatase MutT (NUDIX family)
MENMENNIEQIQQQIQRIELNSNIDTNHIKKIETHSVITVSFFDKNTNQLSYLVGIEGIYLRELIDILDPLIYKLVARYAEMYNLYTPCLFQYDYDESDIFKEQLSLMCNDLETKLKTSKKYYEAFKSSLNLNASLVPSQQDIRIRYRKSQDKWEIAINLGKFGFPKGRMELIDNLENEDNYLFSLDKTVNDTSAKRELLEETGIDISLLEPNSFSFFNNLNFTIFNKGVYKKYFIHELRLKSNSLLEVFKCINKKNKEFESELTNLCFLTANDIYSLTNINSISSKTIHKILKTK